MNRMVHTGGLSAQTGLEECPAGGVRPEELSQSNA